MMEIEMEDVGEFAAGMRIYVDGTGPWYIVEVDTERSVLVVDEDMGHGDVSDPHAGGERSW